MATTQTVVCELAFTSVDARDLTWEFHIQNTFPDLLGTTFKCLARNNTCSKAANMCRRHRSPTDFSTAICITLAFTRNPC